MKNRLKRLKHRKLWNVGMIKVRFDTCMWSGAAISYGAEHKEGNTGVNARHPSLSAQQLKLTKDRYIHSTQLVLT